MKLLKSRKAGEGEEKSVLEIIGWILLGALLLFAILWYSGIGKNIVEIGNSFFK